MSTAIFDARISEFETEEQAASYDAWFRAKVQEAIDDTRPRFAHDQVAQRLETLLADMSNKRAAKVLSVVWSADAEDDLAEIIQFIGERNPRAAERLWSLVSDSVLPLSDHPYLYRKNERIPGSREVVPPRTTCRVSGHGERD